MTQPPTGPSGWGDPDPRQRPQPPMHQPQPGTWGPARGYGAPQWGAPPGPSGGWGAPPPQPPKKTHTGAIIGAIAAAVVIVVGVVITVTVLSGGNKAGDEVATASSATSPEEESSGASPDEDDVQAAAEKRVELINTQDASGLHRMACDADSRTESTAGYQDLFAENGPVSAAIDVRDVAVDGQVGTVEGVMSIDRDSGDVTWSFKKEDGEWRFCPSLASSPTSGPDSSDDDIITG